jgi:hypothetical protein
MHNMDISTYLLLSLENRAADEIFRRSDNNARHLRVRVRYWTGNSALCLSRAVLVAWTQWLFDILFALDYAYLLVGFY